MCKDSTALYRFAIYAALAALTATLGWVVVTLGTSVPTVV
jgi:hypothetical protein